jgi:hypothetical protein
MKKYVVAGSIIFATFGLSESDAQQKQGRITQAIELINVARKELCVGKFEKQCLEEIGIVLGEAQELQRRIQKYRAGPRTQSEYDAIQAEGKLIIEKIDQLEKKFPTKNVRIGVE